VDFSATLFPHVSIIRRIRIHGSPPPEGVSRHPLFANIFYPLKHITSETLLSPQKNKKRKGGETREE